jgi:hypothetical protein
VLSRILVVLRSEVDQVALPLVPFMSTYVARLKNLQKRWVAWVSHSIIP